MKSRKEQTLMQGKERRNVFHSKGARQKLKVVQLQRTRTSMALMSDRKVRQEQRAQNIIPGGILVSQLQFSRATFASPYRP